MIADPTKRRLGDTQGHARRQTVAVSTQGACLAVEGSSLYTTVCIGLLVSGHPKEHLPPPKE